MKTKLTLLLIPLFFLFTFSTSNAHGVQTAWCWAPDGEHIRVYIEHWHGDSQNQDCGAGATINVAVAINGDPPATYNNIPFAYNQINTTVSNLPHESRLPIQIISTCSQANTYNDWGVWDFPLPEGLCPDGGTIQVTVLSANDCVFNEACPALYPASTNTVIVPADCPCSPDLPGTDADGDGWIVECDCDDTDSNVNPGMDEVCGNGIDDDCDGVIDTDDDDGDGIGACDGDCDDNNPNVYPGAPEICDALDNDCDGVIPADEVDADGDGYACDDCDDNNANVYPLAPEICDGLDNDCDGLVDNVGDGDGDGVNFCDDCDDNDPTVYPGAPELCDGLDNDCDGTDPTNELDDADGDGFAGCQECDDNDPNVYPGATEVCNGVDDNCDGVIDEGFADFDGDGFTAPGACSGSMDDCDDNDPNVYPGAPELCDGKDNDCDGNVETGTGYNVSLANTNMDNSCGAGNKYVCTGEDLEFEWTSTNVGMSGGSVEFSIGVVCSGNSPRTVMLNGVVQTTITPADACTCGSTPQPFVVSLDPADYVSGGVNTITIQADNTCLGLWELPQFGTDIYANACIDYCVDPDGDGVCGDDDNCPNTANADQADADCDGVGDVCDICDNGDDTIDNNGDGIPDCSQALSLSDYSNDWKCGNNNNKINLCHVPPGNPANWHTICISANAVPAHLSNHTGDSVGPCISCNTNSNPGNFGTNNAHEMDDFLNVKVYPNPAVDNVNLRINGAHELTVIYIYDINGKVVWQESVDHSHGYIEFDLSGNIFNAGVYTIFASNIDETVSQKLIVIK